MIASRNKYYLLNFVFLACVFVLFLNDHYWKYRFSNWVAGKLSDVCGLVVLPLLLAFLLPKQRAYSTLVSALLFVFWKLPFSQGAIDVYNEHAFIQTSRIVDYSDLFALFVLPVPHFIIKKIDGLSWIKINRVHPLFILLPTILTLMATSPPQSYYYTRSEGNLKCYDCSTTVNYTQEEIVEKLRKFGIVFDSTKAIDTATLERFPALRRENARYYRLNKLVVDGDTLSDIDFTMRTIRSKKTKIYFNGMQVPDSITNSELYEKLRKQYKKTLFKEIKRKLNE